MNIVKNHRTSGQTNGLLAKYSFVRMFYTTVSDIRATVVWLLLQAEAVIRKSQIIMA